ncbi:MAG TPA: Xaa-Pro peptidase family protein [Solirubrobacterales bacterium]|jgi:Xaa-Pro aminopeptidase|nr:Xaa-Pro peptidase family protein [Solirubrobacterales bacterium]
MRARGDRLEAVLGERELERMLVTDLTNVRYLTGFSGTNGAAVCGPGVRVFLTDFRYTERAAAEVSDWEIVTVTGDWLAGIAERLSGKVGFEDDHVSVRTLSKLEEKLPEGAQAVAAGGAVEGLRRVKDESELTAIAEASKLADAALEATVEAGFVGKTEREVADAFEAKVRALGGVLSFDTIVAAGPNGAQPHAEPGPRVIEKGELVVFDMGAKLDGYCSDGTRTYATGDPGEEGRRVYEIVLEAQLASLEAIRPGVTGEDVDKVARKVIDDAGHGEHFGHGLGHGVGLEIHEGPRLSLRSDDVLATNEVVTVEPGIYLAGNLGVRIEDFVVVTDDGYRNLSSLPKELTFVD